MVLTAQLLNLGTVLQHLEMHSCDALVTCCEELEVNEELLTPPPLRTQRHLGSDALAELVQCYRQGVSVDQLIPRYGISRSTVFAHISEAGARPRPVGSSKLSTVDIARAQEFYQACWSLARLGERFGVNAETMRRHLIKAGVTLRPRRGWPADGG